MKMFSLLLGLILSLYSCQQFNSDKGLRRLVIDRNMNEKQIDELIASADSVNIKLDVQVESYDEQGRIKMINGNVEFGENGNGKFYSENLDKIIITQDLNSSGGFSIVVK